MAADRFSQRVAPHLALLTRIAAALVGLAAAEDAVQEALVRAWRKWDSLRDDAALRAWLARITVNVCHDWQRGAFGAGRRAEASLHQLPHDPVHPAGDPGDPALLAALDLLAALEQIALDLRSVVALRYFAGMDATEIGQALGIPPATARTKLKRALEQLRAILRDPADADQTTPKGGQHGSTRS